MPTRRTTILSLLLLLAAPAHADEARLMVLHTTDLHGSLTPYDYLEDRPAARGLVRLASLIGEARGEGVPILLLDAGDCMQGGPVETVYREGDRQRPEPMIAAMSRLGYDALAVGNHEFSFGRMALRKARAAATFPWLAANIVHSEDGRPAFRASLVQTLGALRVGVVGVCTPAVPLLEDWGHIAGLRFLSPVEAARREIERLRGRERCDVVVILAHTGLERDPRTGAPRPGETPDENWGYRLATEVAGVDVVILGHTHEVVPAVELGGTLVTQAGKWGEHLGRVDLTFQRAGPRARWKLTHRQGRVITVSDSTASDPRLAALAEPYHQATRAALDHVIGYATVDVDAPLGRLSDGAVWELIHRAQLEATDAEVSLTALFDAAAALRAGPIRRRDVYRLYPYDNTLSVVELTGRELKETLEHSARFLAEYTYEANRALVEPGFPGYQFDSAEGVGYEIDLTQPVGGRIVNLTVRGQPLAPDRLFRVVANSYRLGGGGGFEALRQAPRRSHIERQVRDLVEEYITRARTLDGSYRRNWRILPDYVIAPERPLIDLMVRQGVAPHLEVHRLRPEEPALRGDLAYWLARAFGWREGRASGAFADVPDSLEPWMDGLLKRGVLGDEAARGSIHPYRAVGLPLALDWCERAARAADYALAPIHDPSFRDGLLTNVKLAPHASPVRTRHDTLTRSQLLGIVANARFPTLRILGTTDFHGAILRGGQQGERALGGSSVLAAHIERLRAENPEGTVLVDGGDMFQGTMISNLAFGRPVVEQMNALGYVAAAIGNHEFDWGADTLIQRISEMRFSALGANLRERESGRLPRWARADTVFARRGVRVGVLGMCYRNTPTVTLEKHIRPFHFADDSLTAALLVPTLRARAQVVIGIGHIPAETDSLARARDGDLVRLATTIPDVDAWLGGHSHNRVADRVNGVPVLIAGSHGQVIAVCDLVTDPLGQRVVESHPHLVLTYGDRTEPDSAMEARVARWNQAVAALASHPVGRNARRLGRGGGEAPVGNLVCEAIREAARSDVALQNSGGLRADLPEGVVTRGAIYEVMPFDNMIVTMELTGAEIRLALEQALARGRVTQVSGIRYAYDLDRPALERVQWVHDSAGQPLAEHHHYLVACNDFMATGGDHYNVLTGGRTRAETGILVRDAIEAYVAQRSRDGGVVDIRPDERIRRIGKPSRSGP